MPGRARLSLSATSWHIIQRGNNRSACFYTGGIKGGLLLRKSDGIIRLN